MCSVFAIWYLDKLDEYNTLMLVWLVWLSTDCSRGIRVTVVVFDVKIAVSPSSSPERRNSLQKHNHCIKSWAHSISPICYVVAFHLQTIIRLCRLKLHAFLKIVRLHLAAFFEILFPILPDKCLKKISIWLQETHQISQTYNIDT